MKEQPKQPRSFWDFASEHPEALCVCILIICAYGSVVISSIFGKH